MIIYLLHLTLHNFSEKSIKSSSLRPHSSYIPLSIIISNTQSFKVSMCSEELVKRFDGPKQEQKVKAYHECTKACLQHSAENARSGLPSEIKDRRNLRTQFLLASYLADISEWENTISIKQDCKTTFPCQRCFVRIPVARALVSMDSDLGRKKYLVVWNSFC